MLPICNQNLDGNMVNSIPKSVTICRPQCIYSIAMKFRETSSIYFRNNKMI